MISNPTLNELKKDGNMCRIFKRKVSVNELKKELVMLLFTSAFHKDKKCFLHIYTAQSAQERGVHALKQDLINQKSGTSASFHIHQLASSQGKTYFAYKYFLLALAPMILIRIIS